MLLRKVFSKIIRTQASFQARMLTASMLPIRWHRQEHAYIHALWYLLTTYLILKGCFQFHPSHLGRTLTAWRRGERAKQVRYDWDINFINAPNTNQYQLRTKVQEGGQNLPSYKSPTALQTSSGPRDRRLIRSFMVPHQPRSHSNTPTK